MFENSEPAKYYFKKQNKKLSYFNYIRMRQKIIDDCWLPYLNDLCELN